MPVYTPARPHDTDIALVNTQTPSPAPWLTVGFRPFFLLAGLGALAPVLAWVLVMAGVPAAEPYYGPEIFHAHEMVFGYVVAVMAGFLLTAIRNWTGVQTLTGRWLGALAGVWIAGRLAAFGGGFLPPLLIAAIDLAFLPLLAWATWHPLSVAGNRRNMIFPAMIAALAVANWLVHAAQLGFLQASLAEQVLTSSVLLALLMITVMAGRVFPMFTARGVPGMDQHVRPVAWAEQAAVPVWLLFIPVQLWAGSTLLLPAVALAAAVIHAARLYGWHHRTVWRVPLVWVLHAGYGWLVIGLALYALGGFVTLPHHVPLHALSLGALGSITLGMMARVALGHTGRPLVAPKPVAVAFILVQAAALVRVFGVALWPDGYSLLVQASGLLWTAAFAIFVVVYFPILTRPRLDGVPG